MLKQTRNRRSRRMARKGFTLLELLLVMAILVVLAGMAGFAVVSMQGRQLERAAMIQIKNFERQCDAYRLDLGRFPNKLDDLHVRPSGVAQNAWTQYLRDPVPLDPWGQAYIYTIDSQNDRVRIVSKGKDMQQGTADDIPQVQ